MNYFQKHWHGDLSLPVSFWINLIFLNILMILTVNWFSNNPFSLHPKLWTQGTFVFIAFSLFIIYPWQFVGVWRACKNYEEKTGKRLWSILAQFVLILGFLISGLGVYGNFPYYQYLYKIGFGKDEFGVFSLEVKPNGKLLYFKGALGFGAAEEIENLLEKNPTVEGIILDSAGGRSYEGLELARIINEKGMDTYSLKGCYSACTTAFIAGHRRFLGLGATLALHNFSSRIESVDQLLKKEYEREQEKHKNYFQLQRISQDFIEKLFVTQHSDFWIPSLDELLEAKVVHQVVNPSDILPEDYKGFIVDSEEILSGIPVYQVLKKYDPATSIALIERVNAHLRKGTSYVEIKELFRKSLEPVFTQSLPKSSDEALISWIRELIQILTIANKKSPILCLKILAPSQYGNVELSDVVSSEQSNRMLRIMEQVIIDSYEKPLAPVDVYHVEPELERLMERLGENSEYYLDFYNLQKREDYRQSCETVIEFYDLILKENRSTAGNILRYLFS